MKPNLFIIGTHKAATSALRFILKQHPDIYFPDQIEMHHFESDLHVQLLINQKYITESFLQTKNISEKAYLKHYDIDKKYEIRGDKTPSYIISKTSSNEIYEFNRNAKIIAVFRDPIDYMYSLHSQNLYNLYEDVEDFHKALDLEPERRQGKKMSRQGKKYNHMLLYRERAKYKKQLERFVRLFPVNNLKCIIFNDFQNSNKRIIKEVEIFLGVQEFDNYKYENINLNKRRRFVWLKKIIHSLSNTGLPDLFLPNYIYENLASSFAKFTTKNVDRKSMDEKLYEELKREFKPIVNDFSYYLKENNLLNKNRNLLEEWGYNKF